MPDKFNPLAVSCNKTEQLNMYATVWSRDMYDNILIGAGKSARSENSVVQIKGKRPITTIKSTIFNTCNNSYPNDQKQQSWNSS